MAVGRTARLTPCRTWFYGADIVLLLTSCAALLHGELIAAVIVSFCWESLLVISLAPLPLCR